MSQGQTDPFTETPLHQQTVCPPAQSSTPSAPLPSFQNPSTQYGLPQYSGNPYNGAGGQASQPPTVAPGYGGYPAVPGYGSGYGYNNVYTGAYPGYGMPYGSGYPAVQRQNAATQIASGARETGAMVLSGMHEAMSRFARVSSLIEEVLRHLHMLFDAIFGLGYSIGAFRQEAGLWLQIKTGPVAFLARLIRRASNVWRLLCIFLMSPMAGRFSPVALVLRILGLVPEEDPLDASLAEMWRTGEMSEESRQGDTAAHADSSNM